MQEEGTFLNSIYEARITVKQKLGKEFLYKKGMLILIFPHEHRCKIFHKM